jgi:hypothetical protein
LPARDATGGKKTAVQTEEFSPSGIVMLLKVVRKDQPSSLFLGVGNDPSKQTVENVHDKVVVLSPQG